MAATVIDGKAAATRLRASVAAEAEAFSRRHGRRPRLVVLIVGDNPASRAYVRTKTKMAAEAGLDGELVELPLSTSTDELLARIDGLNRDPHTHGILVQLPLPEQVDDEAVLHAIRPEKDVDGFHPLNVGRLSNRWRRSCWVRTAP
jgi:methylenetetrahydrofolate dehydrogenase (NADP+)/methenyltetrahydrofolate cyclohydrolase